MALDDIILECRARGLVSDTVRFLRFDPPAVLVGYHQDIEHEVRLDFVRQNGIDVNRRLTGGGAILFDSSSIGWEAIASRQSIGYDGTMENLFERMCQCVVKALELLGVRAAFRPRNDIEVNGRKISGTGGVGLGDVLLFQGTLLVDFDIEAMIRALRIPVIKLKDKELDSVKKRVTCLKWELGEKLSYDRIQQVLVKGFEEVLEITLNRENLTELEEKLLEERLPWFSSDNWIFLNRRSSSDAALVHAADKKPGGVINVSLTVDKGANIIKSALITGDFFVFPPRAVMDLEAALRFIPCDAEAIRKAINKVFVDRQVKMLGITPDDIVKLVLEALDKTTYDSLGIEVSEVNHIYPVVRNLRSVLENGCEYLLLPYCAKMTSCKYRWKEGCVRCGQCTVGKTYELADRAGLKPITIQNFEHLMKTLEALKKAGAKGYLGCCCEAFYYKHRDDLERIGIPGVIINIDDKTCYDLGKAEDAYKGRFEAQTNLKLSLLSRLIEKMLERRLTARCVGST